MKDDQLLEMKNFYLNIVSKCHFSLHLNICELQTGPGKFFMWSWNVLDFFVSKKSGNPGLQFVLQPLHIKYLTQPHNSILTIKQGNISCMRNMNNWIWQSRKISHTWKGLWNRVVWTCKTTKWPFFWNYKRAAAQTCLWISMEEWNETTASSGMASSPKQKKQKLDPFADLREYTAPSAIDAYDRAKSVGRIQEHAGSGACCWTPGVLETESRSV